MDKVEFALDVLDVLSTEVFCDEGLLSCSDVVKLKLYGIYIARACFLMHLTLSKDKKKKIYDLPLFSLDKEKILLDPT